MVAYHGVDTPERQSWQKNGKPNGAIYVFPPKARHSGR